MSYAIQQHINHLIKPLEKQGITGFKMQMVFSDGSTLELEGSKEGRLIDSSQTPLIVLERLNSECSFIFKGYGMTGSPSLKKEKGIQRFEAFCIYFLDSTLEYILSINPDYGNSFILSNKILRDAVIRKDFSQSIHFTGREQRCLLLAVQGKSVKTIAKELEISPYTVEQHLKHIREALHCDNLMQAILVSMHHGIIGKISPVFITN